MDSIGKPSTGWTESTDQAGAKVAEGDASEQGPNGLETGWDSGAVGETAQAIEDIATRWTPQSRDVQMLRALCCLVQEQPDRLAPGDDDAEWGFEAWEIGERIRERFNAPGAVGWQEEPERGRRRMTEYWKKLADTWARQWPTIADGLDTRGYRLRPQLHQEKGGGTGNRSRYGFRFDVAHQPTADESVQVPNLLKVPQVTYRQQDISGNRLVRWISNRGLYLSGWRGAVFFGPSVILLLVAALWSWIVLVAMSTTSTVVGFLKLGLTGSVTLFVLYLLIGWQVRLAADRVILVPILLQAWLQDGYLLELRKGRGAARNTLHLIRYVADCPICGPVDGRETIHVASGRLEFFGRLVGRCDRAPNAHVFSFDHISKQGRFMR